MWIQTVAKAKKEDGQDASVFSCEYKWSISAKRERMFRIRRKLVKKGAKAEACKDALEKYEEWLKSFENQWFFELALKKSEPRGVVKMYKFVNNS